MRRDHRSAPVALRIGLRSLSWCNNKKPKCLARCGALRCGDGLLVPRGNIMYSTGTTGMMM